MSLDSSQRLTALLALREEREKQQQLYPRSRIKVGAVLYKIDAYSFEDGTSKVDVQEWIVRSIAKKRGTQTRFGRKTSHAYLYQDKYVHLTQKVKDATWGKLSTKHGDFGWFKSISQCYREKFKVGDRLPLGMFTTIQAALKYAIKDHENSIKRCQSEISTETDPQEIADWECDLKEYEKELKVLKTRMTRLKNSKKSVNAA